MPDYTDVKNQILYFLFYVYISKYDAMLVFIYLSKKFAQYSHKKIYQ